MITQYPINNNISKKWDEKYSSNTVEIKPCSVLVDYGYLLPTEGLALDLACGLASNAIYLASQGLDVQAIDISSVAVNRVNKKALEDNISIHGIIRDIEMNGLPLTQFNVIVVSCFLNRELVPEIIAHLKEGGLLFYQTWIKDKTAEVGPKNPDFLLNKGELLGFCKDMDILHYHEEGVIGDISKGRRNQASIIAVR